jgi:lipopolysaccharide export system protein LptA
MTTSRLATRMTMAALTLSLLTAGPAAAQLSTGGGPISYSADTLDYTENQRIMVLTGNVDVTQDDARLQADKLTLYFRSGPAGGAPGALGAGDIDKIVAEGRVFYVRPDQKARGDRAVYETSTDSVTFTGNVVVASLDNVIRGNILVMQIIAGRTTIRPSKPGERVQGVVARRRATAQPKQ